MRANPQRRGPGEAVRQPSRYHLDRELPELAGIDLGRRATHRIEGLLRLGECHHVAERLGPANHHGDAIHTEGDPSMRRGTIGERVEQKVELAERLLTRDAEDAENFEL